MSLITNQTRQMSFEDIKEKQAVRYEQILSRLDKPKTAKEIAVELFELGIIPSAERNYTAPRLTELYEIITKLAIVCIRKNVPLIIENPYSTTHYLTKYWSIPATVIDKDRTLRGDFYKKPTQYWFINCKPKYNMIFEAYVVNDKKTVENTYNQIERSMISKEYANRFIREFILD